MSEVNVAQLPDSLRSYFQKSGVALSLAVVGEDDVPLVMVNPAFTALTGYEEADVLGRNCRFLQGSDSGDAERRALHDFIHDPGIDAGRFPVLNYRKDGSVFHNLVFMTRLRDRDGDQRFILGSQFDMTTPLKQMRVDDNDRRLERSLTDIEMIGREYGLAMLGSAALLSSSVATIARLSLSEDGA